MTTPIDPMAAVKLLREALRPFIKSPGPNCMDDQRAREALRLTASIQQPASEATIDRLERICSAAYQMAGVLNAPVRFMDALANPLDATEEEIEALLPIVAGEPGTFDEPAGAPVDERAAFELVANAPLKRHAIYTDQYEDVRTQDLWSIWQARAALQQPGQADKVAIVPGDEPKGEEGSAEK